MTPASERPTAMSTAERTRWSVASSNIRAAALTLLAPIRLASALAFSLYWGNCSLKWTTLL